MTEELKQRVISSMERVNYLNALNISIDCVEEGKMICTMPIKENVLNNRGSVHGGALYTLADSVCGFAARTFGCDVATVDGTMNYLLPAMNSEYIRCEAILIRRGKSVIVYRAELTDDTGRMVDIGTFTYMVLDTDF